ncbi:MAG TPA: thiamine pyrophosphate-dependent enzyme [Humisphaera sp.]
MVAPAEKTTAADVLVECLIDWGVEVIFGLPGDGINGIMESLRQRREAIRFVQVRHEQAAAFMACGYAKYTGRLGVCLATGGPGGLNLLTGLYDAKLDKQPVLAITGHHFHDLIDTYSQQDVALDRVLADVAVYSTRVMGPSHVENVTDAACRHAIGWRGVAHVNFASDMQREPATRKRASDRNKPHHSVGLRPPAPPQPDPESVRAAADLLNAARRVTILAGRGALGAGEELERVAGRLGAPIVKALLGKAAVDDDSPLTTGGTGLLGTKPSVLAMEGCDALLIAGSSFPYIEFYPKPGQARCVQVDADPARIGLRHRADVPLVADCKATLAALLPLLGRKDDRSFLEALQAAKRDWDALLDEQGKLPGKPMKPQVFAREIGRQLPPDAVVSWDSGTNTFWAARYVNARRDTKISGSGLLASMACALPYANAAAVAFPDRPSVAIVGDGGLSMSMAELATAVKYGLNVKVFVFSNHTLGQIKWEQMVFEGNPEFAVDLHPIDFAKVAEACGATGITVDDPADAAAAVARALATPGVVVVNALVDPLEPPLPPKVSEQQAEHFEDSLRRGQPDAAAIRANVERDRKREMVT